MRRPALVLLLCLLALAGPACGSEDIDRARERAEQIRDDVEQRIQDAEREFEERRERYGRRFDEILRDLEKVFERPEQTKPQVRSRGNTEATTIDAFLTDLLTDVDRFWERTFAAADLPQPRVSYNWIPPGGSLLTACGDRAGDTAAFYCPADDTIYVAQVFAAELYEGLLRGLPGQEAGYGRAAGDFAVAYVVAHEYAHNLQQELGVFDNSVSRSARPFELQADCMAGVWAYSVFAEGAITEADVQEAADAALAVGDFDTGNAQHHGTPEERRDALLAGFETGEPSACEQFLV